MIYRAQLRDLAKVPPGSGNVAWSAATIAIVAPHSEEEWRRGIVQYDLGQATMSIMLVAADLGIGSSRATVFDQDMARRILGFPEDRFCAWMIGLGYPSDRPLKPIKRPARRPFDEVVHRGSHEEWSDVARISLDNVAGCGMMGA